MKKKSYIIIILLLLVCSYIIDNKLDSSYALEDKIDNNLIADVSVHYLDVGQGDSIFIELPDNRTMLIDGGEKENAKNILKYIQDKGYNCIDYLVATHPHTDHIGSLKDIVNNINIGKIYMPKVISNTKTYENLLKAIDNKGLKITTAKAGNYIINESDLQIEIISPNDTKYDEINNYSVCLKLTYKDIKYLFMGDAEKLVEKQITADVKADVLKVGHHGSSSSSSIEFLKKVSPMYAIISVGKDNKYNHPHKETLDELEKNNIEIHRTDLEGTIVVNTDGHKISFGR